MILERGMTLAGNARPFPTSRRECFSSPGWTDGRALPCCYRLLRAPKTPVPSRPAPAGDLSARMRPSRRANVRRSPACAHSRRGRRGGCGSTTRNRRRTLCWGGARARGRGVPPHTGRPMEAASRRIAVVTTSRAASFCLTLFIVGRRSQWNPCGIGEDSASFFFLENPFLIHSYSISYQYPCRYSNEQQLRTQLQNQ